MAYCLICYKNCDNPAKIYNEIKAEVKSDMKRFLKLLERYINGGKDEGCSSTRFPKKVEKVVEAGIVSCKNCHSLMEEFCDIYYILEETEMILNWKLKYFTEIMEGAASNNLLKCLKVLEDFGTGVDRVAEVIEWRRMTVTKCKKKIRSSFPKLILKRSFMATCLEMSTPHNDSDESLGMGLKPLDNINEFLDENCDNDGSLIDLFEATDTANIKNELAYPSHEEIYADDPAQPLHDESNFSDNNLENIIPTDDENSIKTATPTIEEDLNLVNSSPVISAKETEVFAPRTLRSIQACPKCSKTFSTTEKLQPHLTTHLNDEEISQDNEIIDNVKEKDCNEYNPDDLSTDESESSSSSSESENDFENSNTSLVDKLRRKYEDDSDILKFISLPCEIEGCTEILLNSKDFEDHKGHHGTFSCSLCPTPFTNAPDLALHELSEHCNGTKKCFREGCDFIGRKNNHYIYHVLVCHLNLKLTTKSRKFNCKICKNGFQRIYQLRRHFPLCRIANNSTNPRDFNQSHLNRFNELRNIKKETEEAVPPTNTYVSKSSQNKLRRKYKADSEIVKFRTLPCQINGCSKILASSEDLEDHKGHHGTFPCALCPASFSYAPDLASHELSNHCKERKDCPREACDYRAQSENYYIHHVLVSHLDLKLSQEGRRFTCKICKTGFVQMELLRLHFIKCRILESRVKCDVAGCTRTFISTSRLYLHKKVMHFTGTQPVCPICNRIFKNRNYLDIHIRKSHQKDLTIPCVVKGCKKKFISDNGLDTHVLSQHKNERDKITKLCPHCGKTFVGTYRFQMHLKSHERPKTKRYICETCGKGFKQKKPLYVHKLCHSGPESWQYQCEICAKKCMTKQKLEEHKRTHGNEKPFVCDVCGAKYAHRHNLRIHVNNKHSSVAQDIARPFDKSNLTSRKGVKRKKIEMDEEAEDTSSSSDSDS